MEYNIVPEKLLLLDKRLASYGFLDTLKPNPRKRGLDVEGASGTGKSIVVKSLISCQVEQIETVWIHFLSEQTAGGVMFEL